MTDVDVTLLGRDEQNRIKVRFDAGNAVIPGWPEAKEALEDVNWEMVVYDPFLLDNGVHDGNKQMVIAFKSAADLDTAKSAVRDHAKSLFGNSKDAGNVEEFADLLPSSTAVAADPDLNADPPADTPTAEQETQDGLYIDADETVTLSAGDMELLAAGERVGPWLFDDVAVDVVMDRGEPEQLEVEHVDK